MAGRVSSLAGGMTFYLSHHHLAAVCLATNKPQPVTVIPCRNKPIASHKRFRAIDFASKHLPD